MAAINNPQLWFAILSGLLPSVIWLYFWMRHGRGEHEPLGLIIFCFICGALAVLIASPLEAATKGILDHNITRIATWASIEEVLKLVACSLIALHSDYSDRPIDPAMYLIATALGFAALENIFYIINPTYGLNITAGLLTGGLRFFGSTLLHAISSCFIGISIGLAPKEMRWFFMIFGLGGAIFLHTTFNFFILKNTAASFLQIYGYLWIAAIISLLILEKLRRLSRDN
ncbi:MAG: PrsW family glutamic-type intramembrane protease [bacterium]